MSKNLVEYTYNAKINGASLNEEDSIIVAENKVSAIRAALMEIAALLEGAEFEGDSSKLNFTMRLQELKHRRTSIVHDDYSQYKDMKIAPLSESETYVIVA